MALVVSQHVQSSLEGIQLFSSLNVLQHVRSSNVESFWEAFLLPPSSVATTQVVRPRKEHGREPVPSSRTLIEHHPEEFRGDLIRRLFITQVGATNSKDSRLESPVKILEGLPVSRRAELPPQACCLVAVHDAAYSRLALPARQACQLGFVAFQNTGRVACSRCTQREHASRRLVLDPLSASMYLPSAPFDYAIPLLIRQCSGGNGIDCTSGINGDSPLDEAMNRLEAESPEAAKLTMLRYFSGLTTAEAAEAMGLSVATAERRWRMALAFLRAAMDVGNGEPKS